MSPRTCFVILALVVLSIVYMTFAQPIEEKGKAAKPQVPGLPALKVEGDEGDVVRTERGNKGHNIPCTPDYNPFTTGECLPNYLCRWSSELNANVCL